MALLIATIAQYQSGGTTIGNFDALPKPVERTAPQLRCSKGNDRIGITLNKDF